MSFVPGRWVAARNETPTARPRSPVWRAVLVLAATATLAGCATSHIPSAPAVPTSPLPTTPVPVTAVTGPALARLQEAVDQARLAYGAPGALAVVHRDAERFEIASGMADRSGTLVSADMQFRVGSITKSVVAALVLDQVAQGHLSLQDAAGNIVGDPLRPEPPITIRMLLNHTSGIFDIGNEGDPVADIARLDSRDLIDEAQALQYAAAAGQMVVASDRLTIGLAETHDRYFQPGAGFHYSNTNYQVAAMALEEISGRALAELVEERISRPLNLNQTTLAPDDLRSPAFRGNAVDTMTGELIDATDDLLAFGNGGSGGLLSTADELTTIMRAIVNGPLLPADLRAEMIRPTPQSGDSYGLGIATYILRCGVFYGHEGSVNGTASIALIDGSGRSVVVAFNRTGGDPHLITLAEQLVCSSVPTS